ncbi:sulfotransferase [Terasakiella pusilla]|uniref:sulfotransferase n=1 Tax=Terasakiella pusilla TaxID=64973 RepID=UPI003AA8F4B1
MQTQPFFIVGCGRSGTQSLGRYFSAFEKAQCEHEYNVLEIQRLGTLYEAGLVSREQALGTLELYYKSAVKYSETPIWGDSSNKLSYFVPLLKELFPQAKFVHVVRDGRKVVSSLFHKLGKEVLDDRSNAIMCDYLAAPDHVMIPPPEKKYWWPTPKPGTVLFDRFKEMSQFERICWHWQYINNRILDDFELLSDDQKIRVKLEDITSDLGALKSFSSFIGLTPNQEQAELMGKPYNVVVPVNYGLTADQQTVFEKHCRVMMDRLGYDDREYDLDYRTNKFEGKIDG